jgi:hypothetical protein
MCGWALNGSRYHAIALKAKPGRTPAGDLRWGIKWGLSAALFFSICVTIVRLASGTQPFDEVGVSYGATVMAYVLLGAVGGCMLGVLRPLVARLWGAVLTGWLLAFMVYTALAALTGDRPWTRSSFMVVVLALVALLVGGAGGGAHWQRNQRAV